MVLEIHILNLRQIKLLDNLQMEIHWKNNGFGLSLKLFADVGIIGLPNAGKSTFLSKISNAQPKVADYPFTTLHPVLGVMKKFDKEIVVADIPGLIEGAHEGKGLGDTFLAHIERCKILLHLVDSSDPNWRQNYSIVRKELEKYGQKLDQKRRSYSFK